MPCPVRPLRIWVGLAGSTRYIRLSPPGGLSQADAFKAAAYSAEMKQPDKLYLKDCIPDFFAPHGAIDPDSPLAACSRRPARLDFIHAPFFRWQSAVSLLLQTLSCVLLSAVAYVYTYVSHSAHGGALARTSAMHCCATKLPKPLPGARMRQPALGLGTACAVIHFPCPKGHPDTFLSKGRIMKDVPAPVQALDSYMETMDPTRKLVVITYVGVWVKVLLLTPAPAH